MIFLDHISIDIFSNSKKNHFSKNDFGQYTFKIKKNHLSSLLWLRQVGGHGMVFIQSIAQKILWDCWAAITFELGIPKQIFSTCER